MIFFKLLCQWISTTVTIQWQAINALYG